MNPRIEYVDGELDEIVTNGGAHLEGWKKTGSEHDWPLHLAILVAMVAALVLLILA